MISKGLILLLSAVLLFPLQQTAHAHYEDALEKLESEKKLQESRHAILPNSDPWKLLELALQPAYANSLVHIDIEGAYRIIRSNGLPNHNTGEFPNQGNPNTMREQNYTFRMSAFPKETGAATPLGMYPFGVAINGVPFDPGAAEWWNNDPYSGWQYEAMALGPRLGLDQNNAHVQPNGAYHYHGLPTGLFDKLSSAPKPVLLGYAADGFPIYAPFSYSNPMQTNSPMKKMKSSFRVIGGTRPSGPGGNYDGTFVQDYEYKAGWGDLDECNGRFGITSEYPKGTYYYVITDSFHSFPGHSRVRRIQALGEEEVRDRCLHAEGKADSDLQMVGVDLDRVVVATDLDRVVVAGIWTTWWWRRIWSARWWTTWVRGWAALTISNKQGRRRRQPFDSYQSCL